MQQAVYFHLLDFLPWECKKWQIEEDLENTTKRGRQAGPRKWENENAGSLEVKSFNILMTDQATCGATNNLIANSSEKRFIC